MDEYVIGQERAKKTLSVAVYNHYTRVQANIVRTEATRKRIEASQQVSSTPPADELGHPFHHHEQEEEQSSVIMERADQQEQQDLLSSSSSSSTTVARPAIEGDEDTDTTLLEKSNVLLIGPTGSGNIFSARENDGIRSFCSEEHP